MNWVRIVNFDSSKSETFSYLNELWIEVFGLWGKMSENFSYVVSMRKGCASIFFFRISQSDNLKSHWKSTNYCTGQPGGSVHEERRLFSCSVNQFTYLVSHIALFCQNVWSFRNLNSWWAFQEFNLQRSLSFLVIWAYYYT